MSKQNLNASLSQRQLRVGELVKQNIGEIFIRNERVKYHLLTRNL